MSGRSPRTHRVGDPPVAGDQRRSRSRPRQACPPGPGDPGTDAPLVGFTRGFGGRITSSSTTGLYTRQNNEIACVVRQSEKYPRRFRSKESSERRVEVHEIYHVNTYCQNGTLPYRKEKVKTKNNKRNYIQKTTFLKSHDSSRTLHTRSSSLLSLLVLFSGLPRAPEDFELLRVDDPP